MGQGGSHYVSFVFCPFIHCEDALEHHQSKSSSSMPSSWVTNFTTRGGRSFRVGECVLGENPTKPTYSHGNLLIPYYSHEKPRKAYVGGVGCRTFALRLRFGPWSLACFP